MCGVGLAWINEDGQVKPLLAIDGVTAMKG